MCRAAVFERTVQGYVILLCASCGAMYVKLSENKYRYVGTTHGNQQLREILAVIDKKEESK
jgi:hypothetical protein